MGCPQLGLDLWQVRGGRRLGGVTADPDLVPSFLFDQHYVEAARLQLGRLRLRGGYTAYRGDLNAVPGAGIEWLGRCHRIRAAPLRLRGRGPRVGSRWHGTGRGRRALWLCSRIEGHAAVGRQGTHDLPRVSSRSLVGLTVARRAGGGKLSAALVQVAELVLQLDVLPRRSHSFADPAAGQLGPLLVEVGPRRPVRGLGEQRAAGIVQPDPLQIAGGPIQVSAGVVELHQPEQCIVGPAGGGVLHGHPLELPPHVPRVVGHHRLGIHDLGIQRVTR